MRRLRRTSSQRPHPSGASTVASARRAQADQRRPLAPWPALIRSQPRAGSARPAGPPTSTVYTAMAMAGLGGLDRQHRGQPADLQPAAQRRVAAVDLIGGHPAGRHPSLQRPLEHPAGQLGLGGEADLVGDADGPAARGIVDPALGQVQLPVDHAVPSVGGIGQVDGDLGVVDLAGGAGVLALHPDRAGALLEIPSLVDHQHRLGSARCSSRSSRRSSRTASWSQTAPASSCCMPPGVASPACSAIVQQFLLGRSASSPSTNARACRHGSTHQNRPATRPSSSSSPVCHRAGSTSTPWPAATVRSLVVRTTP